MAVDQTAAGVVQEPRQCRGVHAHSLRRPLAAVGTTGFETSMSTPIGVGHAVGSWNQTFENGSKRELWIWKPTFHDIPTSVDLEGGLYNMHTSQL